MSAPRESGKRTRLRFGAVSAEVSLVKASMKPREAQHETRRVLVEVVPPGEGDAQTEAYRELTGASEVRSMRVETTDPFGDPVAAPGPVDVSAAAHAVGQRGGEPDPVRLDEDHFERRQSAAIGSMLAEDAPETSFDVSDPAESWDGKNPLPNTGAPSSYPPPIDTFAQAAETREYVPPATRVEQGVHLETGEWVDLTERLAEVDERTKVDGLEVVRTIPGSSYASDRVRELHYLAGVNPGEYKVLALLWRALRLESKAAEVRWTKRTAQASGIILARGELGSKSNPAHLALLELEWTANVRKPSPRVKGPMLADVGVDEVRSAVELVQSFAAPAPREELRDERLAKRAELLELARAGKLAEYVPPAAPMPEDVAAGAEGLAEALSLAAAWNREHAPA